MIAILLVEKMSRMLYDRLSAELRHLEAGSGRDFHGRISLEGIELTIDQKI